ncbi:MAG: BREX-3 system P-loop-containing protein BrxF [Verrucomicrobia bacterium]|nr:BREX-3 system P-loop-containing protein BrxF [Verrucomicrobiota bacterium]
MTDLSPQQLSETVRATRGAYHKLTIIAGPSGAGKTRLLGRVATDLQLPCINLSLLLSQRLLSQTRRQRALKAEEVATEVVDEHLQSGLCLDDTELLFDATLRLNPLTFLQDISRNRLIVASWNGPIAGGELRFAYAGHPDFFTQAVSGYPVVSVAHDKLQLYLAS